MKIITKKQIVFTVVFLIIAGLGALWLTFCWNKIMNSGDTSGFGKTGSMFDIGLTTAYYTFNSILLILLGIVLSLKKFKVYSILAIILGFSVTISLFAFDLSGNSFNPINNLFFLTVIEGMYAGFSLGGIVLVPLFLFSVYKSTFQSIKYFRKKLTYEI